MIDVELKLDLSRSNSYFDEAHRYSPGGAPDAKGWERDLFYIERAKGNRLWDLDGNEYIDYNAGAGPIILGHSHDELDDAVIETIRNVGVQVAQPHTLEVELTKKLREVIPGAEQSAFCNAGTDTLQYAVRMARTYTGRQKVVKFEGGYHGWADGLAHKHQTGPGRRRARLASQRRRRYLRGPSGHPREYHRPALQRPGCGNRASREREARDRLRYRGAHRPRTRHSPQARLSQRPSRAL